MFARPLNPSFCYTSTPVVCSCIPSSLDPRTVKPNSIAILTQPSAQGSFPIAEGPIGMDATSCSPAGRNPNFLCDGGIEQQFMKNNPVLLGPPIVQPGTPVVTTVNVSPEPPRSPSGVMKMQNGGVALKPKSRTVSRVPIWAWFGGTIIVLYFLLK